MTWKQPIPTNLDEVFKKDFKCQALYIQLLLRSANKDGFWTDEATGRTFVIKRGDVIFGKNKWAKILYVSPATVNRLLTKLKSNYKKVSYSVEQGFTRVSIINYDEITDMRQRRDTGETVVNTSKSVKSEKKFYINKYSDPKNITEQDIKYIAERYSVSEAFVLSQYESMVLWKGEKPNDPKRQGRDWKLTLMRFVREKSNTSSITANA